ERLQERVPGRVREHVDLVHDVNLESVASGAESEPLLQSADLVDAVVAGGVDLLDVHVDAGGDLRAGCASLTGRRGRALRFAVRSKAVQALREDARAGRL